MTDQQTSERAATAAELARLRKQTEVLASKFDELQVVVSGFIEHGSRNFLRYRHRATFAFVGLYLAAAIAGWFIARQAAENQARYATATEQVALESCRAGNDVRANIVAFLALQPRVRPSTIIAAENTFRPLDCAQRVALLRRAKP